MSTILLVDDQPVERRLLYHALKGDYRVLEAEDGAAALQILEAGGVDLVVLDLHLPPDTSSAAEGLRLERALHDRRPLLPVVIVTGDQDRRIALELVGRGVTDVLLKPIDPDVLKIVIVRALERARLEIELDALRRQVRERFSFGSLIGRGPAMREVFTKLERLAGVPTTVLLLGESGTGKSAVARTLHNESPRGSRPFVVVDGAAISGTLIESELFGHVRGAFTGAGEERPGRIRAADGGTLLLDEIGNLDLTTQAKLLLFLDDHRCTPVGSAESVQVDVRLIAASNRDLDALVREGSFREDLLFRLQVASLVLPPLRERTEDIAPLAEHLLAQLCEELKRPRARLTAEAVTLLESFPWPGNVRQLRHVLEGSLVLTERPELDAGDLALPSVSVATNESGPTARDLGPRPFKEAVADYERTLLVEALAASGGNKAAAGRRLGLDENQIRYLCRKYRLG